MFAWRPFVLALFVATCASTHAADIKSLPDDTEMAIVVNLKQLRSSKRAASEKDALDQPRAMLKRLAGELPILGCLQDAGLDLVRDLNAITFAGPQGKEPMV